MLGVFQLIGIPPAPRGVPQIEVTFDIDANGILNVVAKDKATNNEQKITITSSSGLSKDEVEKMAKDAESHAADDRKAKDQIEARNRADAMVYNVEKTLKEHRDKVGADDAKNIEDGARGREEADQRERSGEAERGDRPADAGQPQAGRGDVQSVVAAGRQPQGGADAPAPAATAGRARSRRKTWSMPSSST